MVISKDFVVSAEALTWADMADLTVIVVGKRFQTPHNFYISTFTVFINGLRVEMNNDDGYNIISDNTFELKETYSSNFRISVGYVKKEI